MNADQEIFHTITISNLENAAAVSALRYRAKRLGSSDLGRYQRTLIGTWEAIADRMEARYRAAVIEAGRVERVGEDE